MRTGNPISVSLPGRGTADNPPNRFEPLLLETDGEWLESERLNGELPRKVATQFFSDHSRSVLSRNNSPDVGFDYSINPYRGCEHGCTYCYARPTHEFLGLSAGLDFETRIMVKGDAPRLLDRELRSRRWRPQVIALSGDTDCYQPIERRMRITRRVLEVLARFGNPVEIITKNALVLRDADILADMAARDLARVTLSVTSLDPDLARSMEPRASTPAQRLAAIAGLARAGIPVRVNVAPVIPGLNDHEIPAILKAAAEAGAGAANAMLVRLPFGVKDLFVDWLRKDHPLRADRVIQAIRSGRGGRLSETRFSIRHKGEGVRAEAIFDMFAIHCRRLGLSTSPEPLATHHFRVPPEPERQLSLGLEEMD